jgi:phage replication O-like protein O
VEDTYTKIPNELLEALAKAMAQGIITARERAVLDWIMRYTYGYHQKNGFFHTSYIARSLGLSLSWTSQILQNLEEKKIIFRSKGEMQINKQYSEWSKHLEPKSTKSESSKKDKVQENSENENEPEPEDPEIEKKVLQFYAIFENVMEIKYGAGFRVSYRKEAVLLVQNYTIEDIKNALIMLKKKMQKEHPGNWRDFVKPTSLLKMIDDLLAQKTDGKEAIRNYGW